MGCGSSSSMDNSSDQIACSEKCENQPPPDEKGDFEQELTEFYDGMLGIQDESQIESLLNELPVNSFFEDNIFPADDSSLFFSNRVSNDIQWKRPHELAGEDAQVFVRGASRADVVQGTLGDCWFLTACAAVARQAELIEKIIDPDQPLVPGSGYRGLVRVRFWRFGEWVTVTIDDRLPTRRGQLVYARSVQNGEFWSSLVEKAYAKLHGSYEALEGGQSADALVDLTGGLAERIDLASTGDQSKLFRHLFKSQRAGTFITCSIKGDSQQVNQTNTQGLVQGHAYTVTALARPTHNDLGAVSLVRVRNPWADDTEWNGAWSDSDPRWRGINDQQKLALNLEANGDGEFWMEFDEFCRQFEDVSLCTLAPDFDRDGVSDRVERMASVSGSWVRGLSAGGSRVDFAKFATNPQYLLTVHPASIESDDSEEDGISVLITLLQEYRRSERQYGIKMPQIGIMIYKTTAGARRLDRDHFMYNYEHASSGAYINLREVYLRCQLTPGDYVLVPATYHADVQSTFMIRLFCESHFSVLSL